MGAASSRSASLLVGARRAVPLLFGARTRSPTLWRRVLDRVGRLPGSLLDRALVPTPHHHHPDHHRQPASPPLHRDLLLLKRCAFQPTRTCYLGNNRMRSRPTCSTPLLSRNASR